MPSLGIAAAAVALAMASQTSQPFLTAETVAHVGGTVPVSDAPPPPVEPKGAPELPSRDVTAERGSLESAGAAITTATERICKPFLVGDLSEARALEQAEGMGFRRATEAESLEGIGEDLIAVLPDTEIGTVTVTLWAEFSECGVTVQSDPGSFDAYVNGLSSSGWAFAGPPLFEGETKNEFLWSPDGRITVVAGRYAGPGSVAPPRRILALRFISGQRAPEKP